MLFTPFIINTVELSNRFVRSATCAKMTGESGIVNDELIDLYTTLAKSNIGTIISGHIFVRKDGRGSIGMVAGDSDECLEGLRAVASAVHTAGDSKIFAQLNHCMKDIYTDPQKVIGPSAVSIDKSPVPEMLSTQEVIDLADSFIQSAVRMKNAGFDGVQLHGAHGYMVSRFLSKATNMRDDEFGGTPEKRAEFLRRIILGIRESVGDDYPIAIKLGAYDGCENGLTVDESLQIGRWLQDWGIDAIEISGGIGANSTKRDIIASEDEAFFLDTAVRFKEALQIPIISVGGYRSLPVMREVIESGKADLVSLSRPFICEPDLILKFQSGEKQVADCKSCNWCLMVKKAIGCRYKN